MEKERAHRPTATVSSVYWRKENIICGAWWLWLRFAIYVSSWAPIIRKGAFFFFAERTAAYACVLLRCVYMNGRCEVLVAGGGGNARCDCSCAISIYAFAVLCGCENIFLSTGEYTIYMRIPLYGALYYDDYKFAWWWYHLRARYTITRTHTAYRELYACNLLLYSAAFIRFARSSIIHTYWISSTCISNTF